MLAILNDDRARLDEELDERSHVQVLEQHLETSHVPPITIGLMYEHAGDTERAIDWFIRAYESRDPDSPYMGVLTKDPAIRSHPRFVALLRFRC